MVETIRVEPLKFETEFINIQRWEDDGGTIELDVGSPADWSDPDMPGEQVNE